MKSEAAVLLGKRIRALRKSQDITQEVLAERCGMSLSHLGKIERGENRATIDTIISISRGLKIPPDMLFKAYPDTAADYSTAYNGINIILELTPEVQEKVFDYARAYLSLK